MQGIGQYVGTEPSEITKDKDEVVEVCTALESRLEELDKLTGSLSERLHRVSIRNPPEKSEHPVEVEPPRSPLCTELWHKAFALEQVNVRLSRLLSELVIH